MNNFKVNINNVEEFQLNNTQQSQIYEVIKSRNNINNDYLIMENVIEYERIFHHIYMYIDIYNTIIFNENINIVIFNVAGE